MKLKERALKLEKYELKHYVFPKGFVLVVDTREQRPLCTGVRGLTSLVDTLHDGDYSIKGFEDKFSIERKQISDFYSYIGKERDRTTKKIKRLSGFDFAGIVVEAALEDLLTPQLYSQVSPEVARGFLASVNVRYGIHTFFNRSRDVIERWILDRAIKYYKVMRES